MSGSASWKKATEYGCNATAPTIALHKPHPGNIVKMYVIEELVHMLAEEDLI